MRTKPAAGVLRLGTRSPNQFVVITAQPPHSRVVVLAVATILVIAIIAIPVTWLVRALLMVVVATTSALLLRPSRVDLWLERPVRGSATPVAARLELQDMKSEERAFVRISSSSRRETLDVPVEMRGRTGVVRFEITPVGEQQLTVEAVVAKRVYHFTV